jgi:CRISPR/Cas system-associated exonuclease Cas4 (RecB family)
MTAGDKIITISDVLEYLFCPRFIYFMHCLDIPQHEESRFKVLKGREVHEEKRITNTEYLRKKLGVIRKELNVFIASKKIILKGLWMRYCSSMTGPRRLLNINLLNSRILFSKPTSSNWCCMPS